MRRRAFIAAGGGAVARQVVARGGDGFRRGLLLGVKRTFRSAGKCKNGRVGVKRLERVVDTQLIALIVLAAVIVVVLIFALRA